MLQQEVVDKEGKGEMEKLKADDEVEGC